MYYIHWKNNKTGETGKGITPYLLKAVADSICAQLNQQFGPDLTYWVK